MAILNFINQHALHAKVFPDNRSCCRKSWGGGRVNRLFFLIAFLTLFSLLLSACHHSSNNNSSTASKSLFCSGPSDGTYFQFGDALTAMAAEALGVTLENQSTVGTLANATGIADDSCSMAIVQEDIFQYTLTNNSADQLSVARQLRTVASLYFEEIHLVANPGSNIASIEDLRGKQVNLGEQNSGTFVTASVLLNAHGIGLNELTVVNEAPSSAVSKVEDGTYDATFYVAAAPISALSNFAVDANLTLVPTSLPIAGPRDNANPIFRTYQAGTIPDQTYAWQNGATNALAVRSLLVVGPGFDDSQLAAFLELMYQRAPTLTNERSQWAQVTKAASAAYVQFQPHGWNFIASEYSLDRAALSPTANACSAAQGSVAYNVTDLILQSLNQTSSIALQNQTSSGSIQNMKSLVNGECSLTLVQEDAWGYIPLVEPQNYYMLSVTRVLMPLYSLDVHLLVHANSGIQSLADLNGKKVNIGPVNSDTYMTASTLLASQFGLVADTSTDPLAEGVQKVADGIYDATFYVDAAPVNDLVDLGATAAVRLVPLPVGTIPGYTDSGSIPVGSYPWQTSEIPENLRVRVTLLAHPKHDDTNMLTFLQAIQANQTPLPIWTEGVNVSNPAAVLQSVPFGWHHIAADYFSNQ